MKRFQAVPRMLAQPGSRDNDTYWWLVWDWRARKLTGHNIMNKRTAKKLAGQLNRHSWLVD